jgi:hypothetical protein
VSGVIDADEYSLAEASSAAGLSSGMPIGRRE